MHSFVAMSIAGYGAIPIYVTMELRLEVKNH